MLKIFFPVVVRSVANRIILKLLNHRNFLSKFTGFENSQLLCVSTLNANLVSTEYLVVVD